MNIGQKRKELMDLIAKLDEARLDALLILLKNPTEDLMVSEDDWAEMEYRRNVARKAQSKMIPSQQDWSQIEEREKEVAEGKVTDTDAREAGKRIQNALRKKRK